MTLHDQSLSDQHEGKRFADLYYIAAAARFETLRTLLSQIDAAGGIQNAKSILSEAADAATDVADNLRYSQHALRPTDRPRTNPPE